MNAKLDNRVWEHRWGYRDTEFSIQSDRRVWVSGTRYPVSGKHLPYFVPFVEKVLNISLDTSKMMNELETKPIPKAKKNAAFCNACSEIFSEDSYSFDDTERLIHSHGQTTADEVYRAMYKSLERVVDMVFYCETEEEARQLILLAQKHNVCLVPYGGGTSVSCALQLSKTERRMIVSVDTKRMNKIEWVDHANGRVCIQAGIIGKDMEEQLQEMGLTTGHEPDSIEFSTLGGWIATFASGMKRNRYGNIEDIVEHISIVTPQGVLEHKQQLARMSMGIQPQMIIYGSEGNLGLITKAVLKVRPVPEVQEYNSVLFPNFSAGLDFVHELSKSDILPASIRLLDNLQFKFGLALRGQPSFLKRVEQKVQHFVLEKIKKLHVDSLVVVTAMFEGSKSEVMHQRAFFLKLVAKHRGMVAGSSNGKRGYLLTFLIAYLRDFLMPYSIMGETYETTVPWDKIQSLCDVVQEEALRLHKQYGLPGRPYVSPRITQLYRTGACVYFTHGFYAGNVENPDDIFASMERSLRQVIMDNGGAISHHHGVGKLRSSFITSVVNDLGMDVIRTIKQTCDPNNIFGVGNNVFSLPVARASRAKSKS